MTTFDVTTIKALPLHSRIVGRERKQLTIHIKKAYRAGSTVAELAAETGRSASFVSRLLDEAGVKRRSPGGSKAK
jgi:hypothetical protein